MINESTRNLYYLIKPTTRGWIGIISVSTEFRADKSFFGGCFANRCKYYTHTFEFSFITPAHLWIPLYTILVRNASQTTRLFSYVYSLYLYNEIVCVSTRVVRALKFNYYYYFYYRTRLCSITNMGKQWSFVNTAKVILDGVKTE